MNKHEVIQSYLQINTDLTKQHFITNINVSHIGLPVSPSHTCEHALTHSLGKLPQGDQPTEPTKSQP